MYDILFDVPPRTKILESLLVQLYIVHYSCTRAVQSVAAGEFKIWGVTMNVPYIKESLGQGLSSYGLDVKN